MAVLIFGVGAVISILHGVERIRHPGEIENPWINYVVLGLSVLFESASWLVALRAFNREREGRPFFAAIRSSKDPTVFTVLFEDTAALAGLVVALVGVVASHVFALPVLDGVASVLIGVILALTAAFLAFESQSLLTGEAADPATREGIAEIARAEAGVDGLNDCRTMHFGPNEILVALSLDFRNDLSAGDVEDTVARLEHRIRAAYPQAGRIYVEAQSFVSHAAVRRAVIAGGGGRSPSSAICRPRPGSADRRTGTASPRHRAGPRAIAAPADRTLQALTKPRSGPRHPCLIASFPFSPIPPPGRRLSRWS